MTWKASWRWWKERPALTARLDLPAAWSSLGIWLWAPAFPTNQIFIELILCCTLAALATAVFNYFPHLTQLLEDRQPLMEEQDAKVNLLAFSGFPLGRNKAQIDVVTDDQGRFVVPDLPKAEYDKIADQVTAKAPLGHAVASQKSSTTLITMNTRVALTRARSQSGTRS